MARPSKYNTDTAKRFTDALRAGNNPMAAAAFAGVKLETIRRWQARFSEFSEEVTRAEAECQVRNVHAIQKAALEHDAVTSTRTVKTVYKTRKTRRPDGTVIEEPVALQEVSESTVTKREWDWRAALALLERRWPKFWREHKSVDVGDLDDETIISLLEGAVDEGG